MESLSTKFLIKESSLVNYYKNELSESKIWIQGKARIFLLLTLTSILSLITGALGILFGMDTVFAIIFITFGAITVYFFSRLSDYFSISYALINYPDYSPLLIGTFFKQPNKKNFLRAYRSDKLDQKLLEPEFQSLDIDVLIEYYRNSSSSLASKQWWSVTLTAVIAFPIWSETVGFLISKGSVLAENIAWAMVLLIISLLVTILVSSVKSILESILLMRSIELNEMVKVLELIKMVRSNTISDPE